VKKCLPFILIFTLLISCGNNPQEEATQAIDQALTLLSDGKCDEAIKLLKDLKDQEKNPIYFKTYASAFACRAGFNMIRFVDVDLPLIDDATLFKSISDLSYSDETAVDSANYVNMWGSLLILGEGNDYKQTKRNTQFGKRQGEDMGVQVLIYSLMTLGKWLNWYGNVDASGNKGLGTNTNSCYLNYTYAPAIGVVSALPGTNACQTTNDGHPDLNGADKIERMCEGLTLITNIYDVLNSIDLSSSSTFGDLTNVKNEINSYRTAADAAGVGYLLDVTDPIACQTLLANSSDMNNAELLFALVLESEHE
jgi:hypothetical protein